MDSLQRSLEVFGNPREWNLERRAPAN
jgi:hypothetical protein